MSNYWLPMSGPNEERECIVHADGVYIYNLDGNRYLDGNSGLWNVPLGYSNRAIKQAIMLQMEKMPFANPEMFSNEIEEELAKKIISIMPSCMKKVFFTCTGSESTELAIKIVRKYQRLFRNTKRSEIAVFNQSYHGNYFGSMSASTYEGEYRNAYKPLLEGFIELPLPFIREKDKQIEDICKSVKLILETKKSSLAAIFIEPILGSAGVIPMPIDLLKWICKFAAKNNIITVFDEISTGMGRTGRMFAFEHAEVVPDIVLLSKGLNNGYLPMGAVVISSNICSAFSMRSDILFHLSTQNGNPICCAAALATVNQISENGNKIVGEVSEKGAFFKQCLMSDLLGNKYVYSIRGIGLMNAIELVEEDGITPLNSTDLYYIVRLLKQNGIICSWNHGKGLGSCIYFLLPYIVEIDEISFISNTIKRVLENFRLF
ncbi:aminotransferase family protein [Clostridium hydrogenum]|uniref:aminotransferase family protein n=1 Tax=Clostridium hydrogenum TaxID=2855764 RepID=UPI001F3DA3A9|nr:aspartate aminotransferase family protein [Clostridium hydrogenum]